MASIKEELTQAPRMIEDAHKFCLAAEILVRERNMMKVSQINAALSIEILLKSFFSVVSEYPGKVYATYEFNKKAATKVKDSHNLMQLAESLPPKLKARLITDSVKWQLESYQTTFTKDRYGYEPNADRGSSTIPTELARELINEVVKIYKEVECTDPWIQRYPNV